ncbi:hypothetical protein BKP45_15965 [Anaerobacillus alkalidiazotrophicus]|uniref:SpoVT-AbrB domain-containing protein n=1 Tax=Anaerobacillus alkalidiazotrophicus TaxID=472963 RepID=A0A1S2M1T2_9BACI|nr:AbrB/MazE/SpoVT family DNA-binding domain-containing protein [Anaerobacillus alkalidiazotrophicus]OIJ18688.1 hypothetical protein BKP45_15965 [Anaerobacillus alkalidiazotrophicus]
MYTKNYSVPVELNKAIDMIIECTVSTRFTVRIPKLIREILSISPGDLVNVGFSNNQEALLISKAIHDTIDNKIIVSKSNIITIPVELRRYLNIKRGDQFKIYNINNRIMVLMKKK